MHLAGEQVPEYRFMNAELLLDGWADAADLVANDRFATPLAKGGHPDLHLVGFGEGELEGGIGENCAGMAGVVIAELTRGDRIEIGWGYRAGSSFGPPSRPWITIVPAVGLGDAPAACCEPIPARAFTMGANCGPSTWAAAPSRPGSSFNLLSSRISMYRTLVPSCASHTCLLSLADSFASAWRYAASIRAATSAEGASSEASSRI